MKIYLDANRHSVEVFKNYMEEYAGIALPKRAREITETSHYPPNRTQAIFRLSRLFCEASGRSSRMPTKSVRHHVGFVIMPPTQKELAKLAGVSSGTVSNVISGSTKVSERARQKVLEAIKVLNYQPNLIARSLRTNRTRTLGIVIPDITIPFFPKIIRGAECAARERGYFLIVLDSEGSPERESDMIALLRAQRVEGMLLVTASGELPRCLP